MWDKKKQILENKNLLYLIVICVMPVVVIFKGYPILWSASALVLSILLFLKDPQLKILRAIEGIPFFYYSTLSSGFFLGLYSSFFIKTPSIVDKIYYLWVFYFFIVAIYNAKKINKVKYED
jgi:hypothetical protein